MSSISRTSRPYQLLTALAGAAIDRPDPRPTVARVRD